MDSETPKPEVKPHDVVVIKKTRFYIIIGVVAVVVAGGLFFMRSGHSQPVETAKPEPAWHRDEPTQKQILQDDYKEKVKEMLDSGRSVTEISKDTRIRKDEVRKIKKENKKGKATN